MTKKKKILLGILAAVLVIIATCGIAYAVAPRDFLQLFLSDATYTKVMLGSNLSDAYPAAQNVMKKVDDKKLGFDANGTLKINFDEKVFGSKSTSDVISNYASTLKVKASANLNGSLLGANCDLADNDGSVLTANLVMDPTSAYLNLNQLNLGWMNLRSDEKAQEHNVGTINETYETIIDKKAEGNLKDVIFNAAKTAFGAFDKSLITVIPNKTLNVGSASATGDVATVVMSDTDFKKCITETLTQIAKDEESFNAINECLPDAERMTYSEFCRKLTELQKTLIKKLEDSGITNVTLEFYVNKRNDIVGLDIEVLSPKNHFGICTVIKDDKKTGMAFSVKNGTEVIYAGDLKKKGESSGTLELNIKTEKGPLNIVVMYDDLEIDDDYIAGHFTTNKFRLPGEDDYGPVVIDARVKNQNDKLNISMDVTVDNFADAHILLDANTTEFRNFAVPKLSEVTPYSKEKVSSAGMKYIFADLPKTHPEFAKVYGTLATTALSGVVGKLFGGNGTGSGFDLGGLLDGNSLGSGIGGIISSAINGDSSKVSEIVGDFFSAFGLK